MEYFKKTIILKGEIYAVLTLKQEKQNEYILTVSKGTPNGDLFLFTSPSSYLRFKEYKGALLTDAKNIIAAALGENWASKGSSLSFDWKAAWLSYSLKEQSKREKENRIKDLNAVKPKPEAQSEIKPEAKPKANVLQEQAPAEKPRSFTLNSVKPDSNEDIEIIIPKSKPAVKSEPETQPKPFFSPALNSKPKADAKKDTTEEMPFAPESANSVYPCEDEQPLADQDDPSCSEAAAPVEVFPFPHAFPESHWYKHEYISVQGSWHYLTGELYRAGKLYSTALAVPGRYGTKPPPWLKGFTSFLTADGTAQGYWLQINPL
jgi:hypothetical protein